VAGAATGTFELLRECHEEFPRELTFPYHITFYKKVSSADKETFGVVHKSNTELWYKTKSPREAVG